MRSADGQSAVSLIVNRAEGSLPGRLKYGMRLKTGRVFTVVFEVPCFSDALLRDIPDCFPLHR
jgi:hypothetical protein